MNLSEFWTDAKKAAEVLSNPSQSSVLASGAIASFSAEVNNLEKQAGVDLADFGAKLPTPLQNVLRPYLRLAQDNLTAIRNPGASAIPSGSVFGLSYAQAALVGVVLFFGMVFLVAKAAR